MKKAFFLTLLLPLSFTLFTAKLSAQYIEAGISIGGANYLGDLTPSQLWTSVGDVHLSGGVIVRLNLVDWITLRSGLHYGQVAATDKRSRDESGRKERNLSFRSDIYEFHLGVEVNILGYRPYLRGRSLAPYVFGGIAAFKFNPQAELDGAWYDLQPLGTEGQNLGDGNGTYSLVQMAVPVGLGVKCALSQHLNLGIEAGMRKTFTDHLDDVSGFYPDLGELAEQNGLAAELSWRGDELGDGLDAPQEGGIRGDPEDLDWYVFTGLTLTYNFIGNFRGRGNRKARKSKCPTF